MLEAKLIGKKSQQGQNETTNKHNGTHEKINHENRIKHELT